jgi:hypothetical protein
MVRGQVLLITRTSSVCLGKEKKILLWWNKGSFSSLKGVWYSTSGSKAESGKMIVLLRRESAAISCDENICLIPSRFAPFLYNYIFA